MKADKILLDHGSGGKASERLVRELMLPAFSNPILEKLDDGASLDINGTRLAFSTDSYVVDPIFFPGGNIGDLAVNGTINDIAMCGAVPLYLSAGLIIEEGFPVAELEIILNTMSEAAKKAGVKIVTGDTKVVPKGAVDKIFINTSGIGVISQDICVSGSNARPGDQIILSGTIADHGITIMTQREEFSFDAPVSSDTASLNHMVKNMFSASKDIHVLRDPTRGGIGTSLNEIAVQSKIGIKIYEKSIPVKKEVAGMCEILGFDPVYIANEGKLLVFVSKEHANKVLDVIKQDKAGKDACIIGEVISDNPGKVILKTLIGGERILDMLTGEQLPRIC
ncbi:MAG: hydrogenase expression/formation protein HypE [Desulfobacterales bacterium]|nr:hydrogenase expression/formation protein HypE [Desulfobacteraceae bacterium]MBT7084893.1 hydrogenase expression/formation protein HypE [Desulfobacterales bacterium]MBT7698457.1 hydrogenase expression/formation protein HypE [Desulfobacterales bacterium]